ncbi:MAG: DUF4160 domain-containing protein [Muribaculaceae bacterium]|nr:DUF4160 domain-containing protein [Muribaculaceae bacterium]
MRKKVIKLTERDLTNIVKETVNEVVEGGFDDGRCLINEMATMNSNDTSGALPNNSCIVEIRPNDHLPRHFHLIKKDCFELKFSIETGEFMGEVYSAGKYKLAQLTKSVKEWLAQPSTVEDAEGMSNRQMCKIQWNIYHPKK